MVLLLSSLLPVSGLPGVEHFRQFQIQNAHNQFVPQYFFFNSLYSQLSIGRFSEVYPSSWLHQLKRALSKIANFEDLHAHDYSILLQ